MQHQQILNYPTTSEMDFYRYLVGGGGGGGGGENDVVVNNDYYINSSKSNNYSSNSCSSSFYGGIMNETTTTTTTESKAIAASRILHKEAEKRRRERINSHLDRLRSLLPCTSKTDKATLLSKVVQRVLELKSQTSELPNLDNLIIPSENDEFEVYIHPQNDIVNHNHFSTFSDDVITTNNNNHYDDHDHLILKASLCCEDRPDLMTDLNQVLNSLNMKPIRAELSTLGGRIHGVIFVLATGDGCRSDECVVFLRDALKGIVQRSTSDDRLKRRRRVFAS